MPRGARAGAARARHSPPPPHRHGRRPGAGGHQRRGVGSGGGGEGGQDPGGDPPSSHQGVEAADGQGQHQPLGVGQRQDHRPGEEAEQGDGPVGGRRAREVVDEPPQHDGGSEAGHRGDQQTGGGVRQAEGVDRPHSQRVQGEEPERRLPGLTGLDGHRRRVAVLGQHPVPVAVPGTGQDAAEAERRVQVGGHRRRPERGDAGRDEDRGRAPDRRPATLRVWPGAQCSRS